MPQLTELMGSCPLTEKGLKESLLPLLELERRALRWYTNRGTRLYFDQLSELCAQRADKPPCLQPEPKKRKGNYRHLRLDTRPVLDNNCVGVGEARTDCQGRLLILIDDSLSRV